MKQLAADVGILVPELNNDTNDGQDGEKHRFMTLSGKYLPEQLGHTDLSIVPEEESEPAALLWAKAVAHKRTRTSFRQVTMVTHS